MSERSSPIEQENRSLREELVLQEQLLINSRSECNNIGTQYKDLNEKMQDMLAFRTDDTDLDDFSPEKLTLKHKELRHLFEAELNQYKDRVSSYQCALKKQSKLIDDLENRVEEYRSKCTRLEAALIDYTVSHDSASEDALSLSMQNASSLDFETNLIRLEQEKNRNQGLTQINSLLREQLQATTDVNRSLTLEIQHLTEEWHNTKRELEEKECDRKRDEESFSLYFTKEHHRLLSLWRHLLSFRSEFTKMKSATEKDLALARSHVHRTSQTIGNACLQVMQYSPTVMTDDSDMNNQIQRLNQDIIKLKLENEREKFLLNERIQSLTSSIETKDLMLHEKDKINSALTVTIESLGTEYQPKLVASVSEGDLSSHSSVINRCCRSVKDIAQIVVDDAAHRTWMGHRNRSLSPVRRALLSSTPYSVKSHCDNSEFLECTVKAVQSSLRRRCSQVDDLNSKLASQIDKNKNQQALIDDLDRDKQSLHKLTSQLSEQLATVQTDMQDLMKETHKIQASFEKTETQKSQLEQMRRAQKEQIDSLNSENDRLREVQSKLHHKINELQEEKDTLEHSESNLSQDLHKCTKKIAGLEESLLNMEKDGRQVQHQHQQLLIDNEILEKEKEEFACSLSKLEKQRIDLDSTLRKLQTESESLKSSLSSLQTLNESLVQEKEELNKSLAEATSNVSSVHAKYSKEKLDYDKEKQALKENTCSLQYKCEDLENQLMLLRKTISSTEVAKLALEEEQSKLSLANSDLQKQISKLSTQKQVVEEELELMRKEMSRYIETHQKLASESEILARYKAELSVKSDAMENELGELKDVLSALKDEKDQLEKSLYMSQQQASTLQDDKNQLETDLENEKSRTDFFENQIAELKRLHHRSSNLANHQTGDLEKKLQLLKEEYQSLLQREQKQHELNVEILIQEKDEQSRRLDDVQANLVKQLQREKEELIENHLEEIANLKKQGELHEREIEGRLFNAFLEKERIEKKALEDSKSHEKIIEDLEQKLVETRKKVHVDPVDASVQEDRSTFSVGEVTREIVKLRDQIENNQLNHEKSEQLLIDEIESLKRENVVALEQVNHLQETIRELKAEKTSSEKKLGTAIVGIEEEKRSKEELEQQTVILQQKLNTQNSHSDMIKKSQEEYKERFRKAQAESSELRLSLKDNLHKLEILENEHLQEKRENAELRNTLHEVEKSRLEIKRDMQALYRRSVALEATSESKDRELSELRMLMEKQEEIETDLKSEIVRLKQKTLEAEAAKEASSKELMTLQRKISGVESKLKVQHEEHNASLQEALTEERSNAERRISLEKSLADTMEEAQDLRLKLNFAEGKIIALEMQISKLEGAKRDVENRLCSLHLSLRSSLGLGSDSGFQGSPSQLLLSPFSSRRESPKLMKVGEPQASSTRESSILADSRRANSSPLAVFSTMDLDHELIRSALQDFLLKQYNTEKERDNLKAEVAKLKRQVEEIEAEFETSVSKLQMVQKELDSAVKNKKDVENQLIFSKTTIEHYEEVVQKLQRDNQNLTERRTNMFHALSSEKTDLENKVTELTKKESKLVTEQKSLVDLVQNTESRAMRAELRLQDFEAAKVKAQELFSLKDEEIEALHQKVTELNKAMKAAETNNATLKMTVERLQNLTDKLRNSENALQAKVNIMEKSCLDASYSGHVVHKELSQLRGEHKNCEHEKMILKNNADNLRNEIAKLKQKNESLRIRVQEIIEESKACELKKVELEGQIQGCQTIISFKEESERSANEKLRSSEHERFLLEEQLARLKAGLAKNEDLRQQAEKLKIKFEKENSLLKKALDKVEKERQKTEEIASRSVIEKSALGKTLTNMEMENQQLLIRVQNLQAQLAELEQRHLERIKELDQKQKFEIQLEVERLRSTQKQLEQILEAKEKVYRQKVAGLEQQVEHLQEHLNQAHSRWKKQYLPRCASVSFLPDVTTESLDAPSPQRTESQQRNVFEDSSGELRRLISPINVVQSGPSKLLRPTSVSPKLTSTPRAKRNLAKSFQS